MSNCLLNGGTDGTYVLSLNNDMKPHPKFLLAVLSLVFSQGEAFDGGERQYRHEISWTHVPLVQAPQHFEGMPQLAIMGDRCEHKNAIVFDAVCSWS